jgi:hypothetical protein
MSVIHGRQSSQTPIEFVILSEAKDLLFAAQSRSFPFGKHSQDDKSIKATEPALPIPRASRALL